MPVRASRRQFLATAAATPLLFAIRSGRLREKLRLGVVGVAGRGGANLGAVSGEHVVALCDVDRRRLEKAGARFKDAHRHVDWREMLEKGGLDAVVVSTPDHSHAPVSARALRKGLHVYCEKPLTHTVDEARTLTRLAREHGLVTQMGTQIHAGDNYRRVVELVRSGAIGAVSEAHVFCGKTWSGGERPAETPDVPEWLEWDLWLGSAPERAYHPAYHPAGWRRWWEFGGGTLGDMGCHYLDLAWWALDLTPPTRVATEGPPVHAETTPPWLIARWDHPASGKRPAVCVSWYDGSARPACLEELGLVGWQNGVLFRGERGHLIADYGRRVLGPAERFAKATPPPETIPRSIGHHREWLDACRAGKVDAPTCRFDYAGPLTEAILLANIAYRVGRPLQFESAKLRIPKDPVADAMLRRSPRAGFAL